MNVKIQKNFYYCLIITCLTLFINSSNLYANNSSLNPAFEVNYDVLNNTTISKYYNNTNKKKVTTKKTDKKKPTKPLLTAPKTVKKKKKNKALLTAPFVHMSPVTSTTKPVTNNQNMWQHALPKQKPITKGSKTSLLSKVLDVSKYIPRFKPMPTPAKNPIVLKTTLNEIEPAARNTPNNYRVKNKNASPIHPKKAPVASVVAEILPIPTMPTTKNTKVAKKQDRQMLFKGDDSQITASMATVLQEIQHNLEKNQSMRLQLHAFATGENGNPSSARRISLSRALSVREYLKNNGIRATRMDIRALGDRTDKNPMDRVDFIFVE